MNRNAEPIHSAGVAETGNRRIFEVFENCRSFQNSENRRIGWKVGIPGTSRYRRTQVINEGGTADDSPFAMRMHGKGFFYVKKSQKAKAIEKSKTNIQNRIQES